MMPNPKPLKSVGALPGERAVMESNASRVKNTDLLESDGRIPWVCFEQREVLVGKLTDVIRELSVVKPEVGVSKVIQSGVQRPAS